jgi:hypothetical protein
MHIGMCKMDEETKAECSSRDATRFALISVAVIVVVERALCGDDGSGPAAVNSAGDIYGHVCAKKVGGHPRW